jgi:methyl-accepting chemotaxis protein
VVEAARKLQESLVRDKDQNAQQAECVERVMAALDSVSTNMMIADTGNKIVYMNKSVKEMLRAAESDLRKSMPHFSVDRLQGANIDQFHKNPAHQQGMLKGLSGTHRAEIRLGGHVFGLAANPVLNAQGKRHRHGGRMVRAHQGGGDRDRVYRSPRGSRGGPLGPPGEG